MRLMILDPNLKRDYTVEFTKFKFPGGEIQVRILSDVTDEDVIVGVRIKNSDDIMTLLLATDALRRKGARSVSLYMPYVPYARQDRLNMNGESLSIKVFADLINSQNYKEVWIMDPHSDVTPALFNSTKGISTEPFVRWAVGEDLTDVIFISPDVGAYKRTTKYGKIFNVPVVTATKNRDITTGRISNITLSDNFAVKDKRVFILDDICDGGATFKLLADTLEMFSPKEINLIVTHGIFSKGFEFAEKIDNIYTTNSYENSHTKVFNIW